MSNKKKQNKSSTKRLFKSPLFPMVSVLVLLGLITILLIVVQERAEKGKLEGNNPYGTDNLSSATIDLLDNKHYQNIILPDELDKRINSGEATTVYFFSPTCVHCKNTTPMVSPLAKELDVDLLQYNLIEFEQGWKGYGITATPTIVFYQDGEEQVRVEGAQSEEVFTNFFNHINSLK